MEVIDKLVKDLNKSDKETAAIREDEIYGEKNCNLS